MSMINLELAKTFLAEFLPAFIGTILGMSFVRWLLMRFHSETRLPFLAEPFPELSTYSKDEQRRLLHEASQLAFRHWRSYVPIIVLAISFGMGAATVHLLSKVTMTIPDSIWARAAVCAIFGGVGGWLAGKTTTRIVRPFLRTCLERANQAP